MPRSATAHFGSCSHIDHSTRVLWHDDALVNDDPDDRHDHTGATGTSGAGALGGAAVEQFQRAALDAVRAARALLDAAESVIQEPAAIEAMVKTVVSVAKSASDVVAGFAPSPPDAADDDGDGGPDDGPDDGFEHISVG